MSSECQWLEGNLESFFCDTLSAEDVQRAHQHVDGCSPCRKAIQEFQAIDPIVGQVFRYNLTIAQSPKRSRRLAPIYAAAVAAAAISIAVWSGVRTSEIPKSAVTPSAQAVSPAPQSVSIPDSPATAKSEGSVPVERTKPQPAPMDASNAAAASLAVPEGNALSPVPVFRVSDAAGYSRTLSDFRNHILIFGVWSSAEPRTIAAVQHLYEAYGSNANLRILGVATKHESRPAGGTFPVVYNDGSSLLGARTSQFVVVDGKGHIRFRGSLLDTPDHLVQSIQSTIDSIDK